MSSYRDSPTNACARVKQVTSELYSPGTLSTSTAFLVPQSIARGVLASEQISTSAVIIEVGPSSAFLPTKIGSGLTRPTAAMCAKKFSPIDARGVGRVVTCRL